MTFKTLVASIAIVGTLIGPMFAFAQEVVPVSIEAIDPTTQLENELAELKARENDPATGFVARFFIHLKIREIENKLNIATALN